ncbi:MAG: S8 family serine peptidase [Marinoscillum sp.]
MTKGVVICNLNRRMGKPSVNAPKVEPYYVSGDQVEIAEVVLGETEYDYYEGTPTWYKLKDGNYVWSGGVSLDLNESIFQRKLSLDEDLRTTPPVSSTDLAKMVLNNNVQIGQGNKVTIALLDSGIDSGHAALAAKIQHVKNYQSDGGKRAHGSLSAGVIVADDHILKGVAKSSSLLDLRVANDNGFTDDDAVYNALNDLENGTYKADVINLSLDITNALIPYIQPIVDKLTQKGMVVVVAGVRPGGKTVISNLQNVIKVGVFESSEFPGLKRSGFDNATDISFLNTKFKSTGLFPKHSGYGDSSAYTALTSGLIAGWFGLSSTQNSLTEARNLLTHISFPIQQENQLTPFKPYI